MTHFMKLNLWPFEAIKSGQKDIEVRLNDDKRKIIMPGDIIVFQCVNSGEEINVTVLSVHPFKSFKALYQSFPAHRFGCEGDSLETMVNETYAIYTKEQEVQYGVLGIEIALIKP